MLLRQDCIANTTIPVPRNIGSFCFCFLFNFLVHMENVKRSTKPQQNITLSSPLDPQNPVDKQMLISRILQMFIQFIAFIIQLAKKNIFNNYNYTSPLHKNHFPIKSNTDKRNRNTMHYKSMPIQLQTRSPNIKSKLNEFYNDGLDYSKHQKDSSEDFVQTQRRAKQELQKFNQSYFKTKKFDLFAKMNLNNSPNKIKQRISLDKIQEKIKKYIMLPQTCKNNHQKHHKNKRYSSISQKQLSILSQSHNFCNQSHKLSNQSHKFSNQQNQIILPFTLRKKINLIKKSKEIMKEQFLTREAQLKYQQRSLEKQQKSITLFKNKLDRIKIVRKTHAQEQKQFQYQRQLAFDSEMYSKYMLRSTVLTLNEQLQNSRISTEMSKKKIAQQVRLQRRLLTEQIRQLDKLDYLRKKRQKTCIQQSQKQLLMTVKSFYQDKRLSVNQSKLQQLSKQIISVQKQKTKQDSFLKDKIGNHTYRNSIKERKIELTQKAKQYKHSLMLLLDQKQPDQTQINPSISLSNVRIERDSLSNVRIDRRKKNNSISTAPDHNMTESSFLKLRNSQVL